MLAGARTGTPRTSTATLKTCSENGAESVPCPYFHPCDDTLSYGCSCYLRAVLSIRFAKTGKRKDIFLATKFAITREPARPVNGEPEYVKKCIEQSLSRLGGAAWSRARRHRFVADFSAVDNVDLYYMHRCACFCDRIARD